MSEQRQGTGSLAPSLRGVSWSLKWNEGKGGLVGQAGAWLRGSAHPLGGAVCMYHGQYPAFAPSTSEVAVEFGPFVSCS